MSESEGQIPEELKQRARGLFTKGNEVAYALQYDYAIEMFEKIDSYLKQDIDQTTNFDDSISQLAQLFES